MTCILFIAVEKQLLKKLSLPPHLILDRELFWFGGDLPLFLLGGVEESFLDLHFQFQKGDECVLEPSHKIQKKKNFKVLNIV